MWNLNYAYTQNFDTFDDRNNLKQPIIITKYLAIIILMYKSFPSLKTIFIKLVVNMRM